MSFIHQSFIEVLSVSKTEDVELRGCYSVCRLSPPPIKQREERKRRSGEKDKRRRGERGPSSIETALRFVSLRL